MKLALVAVALVASVAACTNAPHAADGYGPSGYTQHAGPVGVVPEVVPVWIDKRFTREHRTAIHEAFAQWNIALNSYEQFEIVADDFDMQPEILEQIGASGQGLVVLRRSTKDPIMEDLPDGVLGWVAMNPSYESHALNLVEDAIGNRNIIPITLHEIGHTLRLPHLPVKHTLMYPSYNYGAPCVDLFTVQTLATVRGWDWRKLNSCDYPK